MTDPMHATSRTRRTRRARREGGSLLVLVLIIMIPLAGLAGSLLFLGSRLSGEQDASRGRARALLNAESGLDHGFAQLAANPGNTDPIDVYEDDGESLRYHVTFEDLGADGVDNNEDGVPDDAGEAGLLRITSAGSLNVLDYGADDAPVTKGGKYYVKRVRAIGTSLAGLPSFPYAVYLGDPLAQLRLNGNAFQISGNDHKGDLSAGSSSPVPGIATVGDPAFITAQLSKQQKDNVTGQAGPPSILNTAAMDIQALVDTYKAAADVQFINPSQNYTGDLGDYDSHDYKVTYIQGTLKITGGGHGAGVMLVDGNLDISGNWEYRGVIIVTGQVIFRGGGGGKRVVGSVLVGGDVVTAGQSSTDLEVSGTVDIYYSSSVQSEVGGSVAKFKISDWQEL